MVLKLFSLNKAGVGSLAFAWCCLIGGGDQAFGQAGVNAGMMWKAPPSTNHPTSCKAILTANPAATSGIYTIDPDAANGPCPPLSVYCDMTYDNGGWTLIASSDGTTLALPVMSSLTSTASAGVLDAIYVKPLAWRASSIRITKGALADGVAVISAGDGPLSKLRDYQVLNSASMKNVSPNTEWTGAQAGVMVFSCDPSLGFSGRLSARIYHACGNGGGLHWLTGGGSSWQYNGPIDNLDLWVK